MKEKETKHQKYGLPMSIAMIIGIVIGSGIFFKADDILVQTNGNVAMGCVVLAIGALGIIFGGITISEWAKMTDDAGGLISYMEKAFGKKSAFLLGWFQGTIYFPALTAVVCYVGGMYTINLFPSLDLKGYGVWILATLYLIGLYLLNLFSARLSGFFQTSSMFIKLIPLFLIAILGIVLGHPREVLSSSSITPAALTSSTAAIVSVAFSYDGWSIAPSICHEIKNAKRNLPLALTIGPIIILIVYVGYFLGISSLIGPEKIMEFGDLAFSLAMNQLFGNLGEKIMLLVVIISVLGTANGLVLANMSLPYSLALRGDLPKSEIIKELHPKYEKSLPSVWISFLFVLGWLVVHFLSLNIPFLQKVGLDISAIPIVMMYIFYTALYISVMQQTWKGNIQNKLIGYLCPILATLGAIIIVYGGLTSSNTFIYLVLSGFILISGILFFRWVHRTSK